MANNNSSFGDIISPPKAPQPCPIEVLGDYVLLEVKFITEKNGIILLEGSESERSRYEATIVSTGSECDAKLVHGKEVLTNPAAAVAVNYKDVEYWLTRQANIIGVLNIKTSELN